MADDRSLVAGLLEGINKRLLFNSGWWQLVVGPRSQHLDFPLHEVTGWMPLVLFLGYLKPTSMDHLSMESMKRERESSKAAKKAVAIILGGRKELMEQGGEYLSSASSSSSSSSSFFPMRQCRICHEEEEDEWCATMESPCACSGSLKYAHRGCVQRWCDEKGSTLCEICLQNFESGYTIPPKKAPVVEMVTTVSEEAPELLDDDRNMRLTGSEGPIDGSDYAGCSSAEDRSASWCRSLTITFTVILLVWHLIAVVAIEVADHCAFSLLTVYLLRAAGIMLPFYAVMRLIRIIQNGQRRYRLQLLEEQRRRNASNLHSTHGQEQQQQLVISVH